jgi:hypothetical protein
MFIAGKPRVPAALLTLAGPSDRAQLRGSNKRRRFLELK